MFRCKTERELRGLILSRLGLWVGALGGRSGIRLPLGVAAVVLNVVLAFQGPVLGDVERRMEDFPQKHVADGEDKRHYPVAEMKDQASFVSRENQ